MSREKRTDRRVKRTQELLTQSLITLLKQKSPRDISVTELCQLADINRGTFYLHYSDINDMIQHLENYLLQQYEELITTHTTIDLADSPYPLVYDLFLFASEHSDLLKALLGPESNNSFLTKLKSLFYQHYVNVWADSSLTVSSKKLEYSFQFLASGCISMLELWLLWDKPEPVAEIAALATDFMTAGYHSLL